MRSSLFIALSALTAFTLASPNPEGYRLARAEEISDSTLKSAPPMTFTGPAFLNGPNITLTGTAKSVYEQLISINPTYSAWDFPEHSERMALLGITREGSVPGVSTSRNPGATNSLSKRDWITCNVAGNLVGNWPTQCIEGATYLENLNGWCGAPAGRGGCSRCSCSHSCGIFLCNDNSYPIDVWCGNLAGDFWDIVNECEVPIDADGWVVALKGQQFRDGPPAWNTVVRDSGC